MKLAAAALASLLVFAGPSLAQQQQLGERIHVVRPGDTLWDLARTYLGDPYLWPEIFRLNTGVVRDPAVLEPAMRLRVPGDLSAAVRTDQERGGQADAVLVGDFRRAPLLAPIAEIRSLGRLAEVESPSVVPTNLGQQIVPFDRVFVALSGPGAARIGDRIQFVRRGRELRPWGWVWESTGTATVIALDGATATAAVDRLYGKVAVGDLVVPLENLGAGQPVPGAAPSSAALIAFANAHPLAAPQEFVFLDIGSGSGVRPGDAYEVYIPRTLRAWGVRPEIPVARVEVVRIAGRTASARIVDLRQPALKPGLPVRLLAASP